MNYKENDKVLFIEDGVMVKGTIKSILGDVAVVSITDSNYPKTLTKMPLSRLVVDVDEEEVKEEPTEKAEITITPGEFREIGFKVVDNQTAPAIVKMAFIVFLSEIHTALFYD